MHSSKWAQVLRDIQSHNCKMWMDLAFLKYIVFAASPLPLQSFNSTCWNLLCPFFLQLMNAECSLARLCPWGCLWMQFLYQCLARAVAHCGLWYIQPCWLGHMHHWLIHFFCKRAAPEPLSFNYKRCHCRFCRFRKSSYMNGAITITTCH